LVIHPKNETGRGDDVKWDDEYTLVVSDWYHDQHIDLLAEFMDWRNPTGAEPVPGELTFRFEYDPQVNELTSLDAAAIYALHKEQYLPSAEAIGTGEGVNDNASLKFEAGKTYKIRIINMSALASEFFPHPLIIAERAYLT
jgi:iron transport multicopper oxidase